MLAMPKKPASLSALERITKKLATTKPEKAHALVYDAFAIAALAGDTRSARRLLHALFALPPLKEPVHALSTHGVDVYCAAAGFGDLGGGKPTHRWALVHDGTHAERVAAIEQGVRARVTSDHYSEAVPIDDSWRTKRPNDPWRAIGRWRALQRLVAPDRATAAGDREAIGRMEELLADWPAEERGPGYGAELVVALDLALRQGERATAERWLAMHGRRLLDEPLFWDLVCHPTIAKAMVDGLFRPLEDAKPAELAKQLDAVADATYALVKGGPAPKDPAPKKPSSTKTAPKRKAAPKRPPKKRPTPKTAPKKRR